VSDDLGPPDRSNTGWALFWREQQAAQLTPGDVDLFVAYERERRWARRRLALAVVTLVAIVVLGSKYFGFW
jgi:hypothetical protein